MRLFRRTSKLSKSDYEKEIGEALDVAFEDAAKKTESVEVSALRAVVFSDLHRGGRDGADDFERCEPAYSAALGWYLEQGFALWLLGDVEELWENGPEEVIPRYEALLELERDFMNRGGLRRFYGNHDLDWRDPKRVSQHLGDWLPGLEIREALRLQVEDRGVALGLLFLVHGHQGTALSDRGSGVSRWVLRHVWRQVQRSQGWLSTTPAADHALRQKHDVAMCAWAQRHARSDPANQRPILIAGHTHHPVFPDKPPARPDTSNLAQLAQDVDRARASGAAPSELASSRAELERLRALTRPKPYDPSEIQPPCYFNTGCCCFPDRDVTCLELADGNVRLVRWLDDEGEATPELLAEESLSALFREMAAWPAN